MSHPQSDMSPGLSPPEDETLGKDAALTSWAILCVVIGLQVMFACIFAFGTKTIPRDVYQQMTTIAHIFYHPEREIPIYLASCVAIVCLCLSLRSYTGKVFGNASMRPANAALVAATALAGAAGYLACLAFFDQPSAAFPSIVLRAVVLTSLWVALEIVLVLGVIPRLSPNARAVSWVSRWKPEAAPPSPTPSRLKDRALDALFVALIISLVFIPDTARLAGVCFIVDGFQSWNYFLIAPLNGFKHGMALETDIYTQYGVGWAMLFTWLTPVLTVSYAHILSVFVGCASVYFGLVYVLLRSLAVRPGWALLGTLTAMFMQLCNGLVGAYTLWAFPSSSVLRSPFDVLLLLALWQHLKTRRMGYWAASALLAGLAVLFETDTGLYLLLTTAIYFLVFTYRNTSGHLRQALAKPLFWQQAALWIVLFLLMLGSGLALASRGTILHAAFWRGWLECITFYSSGMSYLPMTTAPDLLIPAFLLFGCNLFFVCRSALRLRNKTASDRDTLLLVIAAYCLLLELQFVGRSHPSNLMHSIALVIALLTIEWEPLFCGLGLPVTRRAFRLGLAIIPLAALMLNNQAVRMYPSLLRQLTLGRAGNIFSATGYSQRDDQDAAMLSWSGVREFYLPPDGIADTQAYHKLTLLAHELVERHERVAVLDDNDANFYLLAEVPPWDRYSPLLPLLLTWPETYRIERRLASGEADVVFCFSDEGQPSLDTWKVLQKPLSARYFPKAHIEPYVVWVRAR